MNGRERRVGAKAIAALQKYGRLNGWVFELHHPPDLKVFSKTDRMVLNDIVGRLGHLSADELEELSHKEPSWVQTPRNQAIPFELFFEGHPEAEHIKEALSEDPFVAA
jgi:uncharacterized phage-associated protein